METFAVSKNAFHAENANFYSGFPVDCGFLLMRTGSKDKRVTTTGNPFFFDLVLSKK